jgi:ATP-dependent protease HslVU (ClpYQ) peptidase subunit
MTVIATDGKTLAVDSRATVHGSVFSDAIVKGFNLPDGSVVGVTGSTFDLTRTLSFFEGTLGEFKIQDSFYLRLDTEDRLWSGDFSSWSDDYTDNEIELFPPAALGSGGDLALGAMLAGATPHQACEIAKTHDTASGGLVVTLTPGVKTAEDPPTSE